MTQCPICGSNGDDLVFKFYCSNHHCQNFHNHTNCEYCKNSNKEYRDYEDDYEDYSTYDDYDGGLRA